MVKDAYPTYEEARNYLTRFVSSILSFSAEDGSTVWRALRAHHPPLNIEDGDEQFYFYPIQIRSDQEGALAFTVGTKFGDSIEHKQVGSDKVTTVTLIKLLKFQNVKLFFGSHHHSAQLLMYPYSNIGKKLVANADAKVE